VFSFGDGKKFKKKIEHNPYLYKNNSALIVAWSLEFIR